MTGHPPHSPAEALVHGCCVDVGGCGVLIIGQPGSGKSDLALRLIDQPGAGLTGEAKTSRLVADDQVAVRLAGGCLVAAPPAALAGRLEVRGIGIVDVRHCAETTLRIAVRLTARDTIERMPEMDRSRFDILGVSLPLVLVDADAASAPARIRAAVDWLSQGSDGA